MSSIHPTRQPIRDVASIAVRRDPALEPRAAVDRSTVIDARGLVERLVGRRAGLVDALREAVAGRGARRAVADHARDDACGARVLHAVLVAGGRAVVVLHQARVADAVVGRRGADAAAALLDDDSEDEAVVHARLAGYLLDGVPDGALVGERVSWRSRILEDGEVWL